MNATMTRLAAPLALLMIGGMIAPAYSQAVDTKEGGNAGQQTAVQHGTTPQAKAGQNSSSASTSMAEKGNAGAANEGQSAPPPGSKHKGP
jgi:hypothetical protein